VFIALRRNILKAGRKILPYRIWVARIKKLTAIFLILCLPQIGWSADAIQMVDGRFQPVTDPFAEESQPSAVTGDKNLDLSDFLQIISPLSAPTITQAVTTPEIPVASVFFDGSGDYLSIADHADFNLSGGVWTIDGWFRLSSLSTIQSVYAQQNDANNMFRILVSTTGALQVQVMEDNNPVVSYATVGGTIQANSWYHFAVVEEGDSWKTYVNGVLVRSITDTDRALDYTSAVRISGYESGQRQLTGWVDKIRVIQGAARWSANFDPLYDYAGGPGYQVLVGADSQGAIRNFGSSSHAVQVTGDTHADAGQVPVQPDVAPPALVGAVQVNSLTHTGVRIEWETHELTNAQIEYGLTSSYDQQTSVSDEAPRTLLHAFDLTGLISETTYHYRIRSQDASGNWFISEDMIFTTLPVPDTTPPVLSVIAENSIAHNEAMIQWATDEPSDSQIEYGLTVDYGSVTPVSDTVPMVLSHAVTLTGLQPGTTYHYRVKSKDAAGNWVVSEDRTFTTFYPPHATIDVFTAGELTRVLSLALPGQTVRLNAGIYQGHFVLPVGVNLIGVNSDTVVVHGNFEAGKHVIRAMGNNLIEGLTVTGSAAYSGSPSSAIRIEGNEVWIRGNIIRNNRGYGLYAWAGGIRVEGNLIQNCNVGIQLPKDSNKIRFNTLIDNNIGINVLSGEKPVIEYNIITGSTFCAIYEFSWGHYRNGQPSRGYAIVENNTFFNNAWHATAYGPSIPPAVEILTLGNLNQDPLFVNAGEGNYAVQPGSSSYGRGGVLPAAFYAAQSRGDSLGFDYEVNPIFSETVLTGYRINYTVGFFEEFYLDGTSLTDQVPPAGTITINNQTAYTDSTALSLSLSATDGNSGVADMRFSTDGGVTWTEWEAYAPQRNVQIAGAQDGAVLGVRVQFRDRAANVSEFSDTIILDTAAPSGTLGLSGGQNHTASAQINLALTVADGATAPGDIQMAFSLDGGVTFGAFETFNAVKQVSLQGADGVKTVTVRYRDAVGHEADVSFAVTLDRVAPSGNVVINGGAATATNANVTLQLSASDLWTAQNQIMMAFSTDGGTTFSTFEAFNASKALTLPSPDGLKTVIVRYRDRAGNTADFSDTINLDTRPLILNNQNVSGYRDVRRTMTLGPEVANNSNAVTYTYTASSNLLSNGTFVKVRNQLTYVPNSTFTGTGTIQVTGNCTGCSPVQSTITLTIAAPVMDTPNDPSRYLQYQFGRVDALRAWNLSEGVGVTVAVIDLGVQLTHPDLNDNLYVNPDEIAGDGIDNDNNGYVDDIHGWDFENNNGNVADDFADPDARGHGTHVTGIIGAELNNSAYGAGIAPGVKIMPMQFVDEESTDIDLVFQNVARSIDYAVANGARVINLSIGWLTSDLSSWVVTQLQNSINAAAAAGVIVVASSGNEYSDANLVTPAGMANVITVSATDANDFMAYVSGFGYFSNYNVDFAAPGEEVYSTFTDSSFLPLNGTSMASPVVAAVAALILAQSPTATYADVFRRLKFSAKDLYPNGWDSNTGWGRVNAFKALSYDYYDNGTVKTQWLESPNEFGWNRLNFDSTGYMTGGSYVSMAGLMGAGVNIVSQFAASSSSTNTVLASASSHSGSLANPIPLKNFTSFQPVFRTGVSFFWGSSSYVGAEVIDRVLGRLRTAKKKVPFSAMKF
jgi:subtilisin family serine protease